MPIINFGGEKTPLTLDERIAQITKDKNSQYQAQPSAGLGAPQTFVLRNLSTNPFIHRIETERKEGSIQTHTTILTNASSESQAFLSEANSRAEEVSKRIVQFAADMFALDVGSGMAEDFMLDNLPPEVDYASYIQTITPKLEQALVKRLASDIGIELFECPEIPDLKSGKPSNNIIDRLTELAKGTGGN